MLSLIVVAQSTLFTPLPNTTLFFRMYKETLVQSIYNCSIIKSLCINRIPIKENINNSKAKPLNHRTHNPIVKLNLPFPVLPPKTGQINIHVFPPPQNPRLSAFPRLNNEMLSTLYQTLDMSSARLPEILHREDPAEY